LKLTGNLALEQDNYKRSLQASDISISNSIDELIWTGGDSTGILNTKNVYEAIISTKNFQLIKDWRKRIWKGNIQLKIKLILWLAVEDKVLTRKILQQRGWLGPEMCHLCKNASEDNAHLFIHCNFTKQTWIKISSIKNLKISGKVQILMFVLQIGWITRKTLLVW
jgi:hypothetical protein